MLRKDPQIICEMSIGMMKSLCRNGVLKDVHVVTKTLPFTIEVSFPLSLHQCKLEASLYYDYEIPKLVTSAISDPMLAKIYVNETGNRATIECRLQVLTSQHNEALFKVKVVASSLMEPDTIFELFSSPIWVVSKTSQASKLLQNQQKKKAPLDSEKSIEPLPSVRKRSQKKQKILSWQHWID